MLRLIFMATCIGASLPPQSVTWFEGSNVSSLVLRTVPESNPRATPTTVLTDVALLPIEVTGRTAQQELDPTRSRRVTRHGLTRVELPVGGRLFAYRRNAGQTYGYLHVLDTGRAIVLLEGNAVAGGSPFADRVGVSPDGRWAVAASIAEDRLYVLRLDGTNFVSTGTPARTLVLPSHVEVESIMPGRQFVFFATDDERMRRCSMPDGGQIEDVGPPPIGGARVKSELALSGDGAWAVYLYGVQPSFWLYMVGENGPSVRLNAPIAKYEEPGYLPDEQNGPRMLLDFDGSRLMYTDATSRDEIFLMDTSGATVTTHVTGDHNFEPYIGIGIFPTFAAATLVLGVGDPSRFDIVGANTNEIPVANLTHTSGNTTRPYTAGSLDPRAVSPRPDGSILIVDQAGANPMRLLRFDPAGTHVVATQLLGLPILADAHTAIPDILVATSLGDTVLSGATGTPVLATPAGVSIATDVLLPAHLRVLSIDAGTLSAIVFVTGDGRLIALPASPGPQRAFTTSAGSLVLDGGSLLHVDPRGGAATITTNGAVRSVVSGRGV